jgi:hypothetical protein
MAIRKVIIYCAILLITMSLTSCSSEFELPFFLTTKNVDPVTGFPTAAPLPQIPKTLIDFRVKVPAGTPLEESILLTVMDEVTGLALNPQIYQMELDETASDSIENQDYRIYTHSLPVGIGSIVKYRYERVVESIRVSEHTADGSPVRYRLYHVTGQGRVEDVVSRWMDTEYAGPTGRIIGQAKDIETGLPIPNLLISAGGAQTITTSDGTFRIEELPPGIHNLVALAIDGSYHTFQQGAKVATDSTTPAPIHLPVAPLVKLFFVVDVPEGTPPVIPMRFAGNLYQLGNTFADLSGGINTLATNMPELTPLPDGRYSLTLTLPSGADIRYKYTLGDGFWNAERSSDGNFIVRQFIVPEENVLVENQIETWYSGSQAALTFDITVPDDTPAEDFISIQFNPLFGWTEPIPMWHLGENRWAYLLYNPVDLPGNFSYRYCRNGQCGLADIPPSTVQTRDGIFMAGVEFRDDFRPSWRTRIPNAIEKINDLGANWIILSPTWSYGHNTPGNMPPILEPIPGQDPLWFDLADTIEKGHESELSVALFPRPAFQIDTDEWWQSAPRDYSWWLIWFDQYRTFLLHHADLADTQDAESIILGGDWLNPALPMGTLIDGTPSGSPADTETRWRDLITEVREHFSGEVVWALPENSLEKPPPFLDAVDKIYILWSGSSLDPENAENPETDIETQITQVFDTKIQPLVAEIEKPVILAVAYPSVSDSQSAVDLEAQLIAYNILLNTVNKGDWFSGFVTRGYYPPAALQDQSESIHGKPVSDLISYWFTRLIGRHTQ